MEVAVADIASVQHCIRKILGQEQLRLTPNDLVMGVFAELGKMRRPVIHAAIRRMVTDGELMYTAHCGTTHVQMSATSFLDLSRLSTDPLNPESTNTRPVIQLVPGLSFGAGDHPTTCMVLEGLMALSQRYAPQGGLADLKVLDIGTGSGVLAIAAALLGAGWCLGIDVDTAACFEARRNVDANGVIEKVGLVAGTLDAVGNKRYDLLLGNLRPPTLKSLMPRMAELLRKNGWWILSGFRPDEVESVKVAFPEEITVFRIMQSRGWAALVAQGR